MKRCLVWGCLWLILGTVSGCRRLDRWAIRGAIAQRIQRDLPRAVDDYIRRYSYSPTGETADEDSQLPWVEVRRVAITDISIGFLPSGEADVECDWICEYRTTPRFSRKLRELHEAFGEDRPFYLSSYQLPGGRQLYEAMRAFDTRGEWKKLVVFAVSDVQEQRTPANRLRDEALRPNLTHFKLRRFERAGWRVR